MSWLQIKGRRRIHRFTGGIIWHMNVPCSLKTRGANTSIYLPGLMMSRIFDVRRYFVCRRDLEVGSFTNNLIWNDL